MAKEDSATLAYRVPGLDRQVEILYDTWGIPHIFAETEPDAFFGQGFAAARDRLWQIDLARRRALGRLAAVLGPAFIPYDHAARLFLFRGDEQKEWLAYGPRIASDAAAFTAGINAYVALVLDGSVPLALEFKKLGYLPEYWGPSDFVRIRAGGSTRASNKVRRARLAALKVLELDEIACQLEPPWKVTVPDGLDPASVSEEDLRFYQLLTAPLPFSKYETDASIPSNTSQAEGFLDSFDIDAKGGSNAWVISGGVTQSGRAILANDPHLSIGLPSVRYISHLSAPGFNVIGASWPGNPGIQNGHNDRIAFGRTNWSIDSEDVYVLRTNPKDPDQYFYHDNWVRMSVIVEEIGVRGASPVTATLKYSAMGPIVSEHQSDGRAISIRANWLEAGVSNALSILRYNFATDWPSFKQAVGNVHYGTNYIYADVEGNIGWQAAGKVPVRPNHDGLMPVPAERRYEWSAFWPLDKLPSRYNPAEGWIASANEMNLPPDYPYGERKIGFEWPSSYRYDRIVEVLGKSAAYSLEGSVTLQRDVFSNLAAEVVPILGLVKTEDSKAANAISLLQAWNMRIDSDSVAAAIFQVLCVMLHRAVHEILVPKQLSALVPSVHPLVMRDVLENRDSRFARSSVFNRDTLIAGAIRRTVDSLEQRLGLDWSTWSLGKMYTASLKHPLAALSPSDQQGILNIDGCGSAGNGSTVMARWSVGRSGRINFGASYSMVLDVGEWDNSLALNSPGQSGDPASPHYRDLHARWLTGEMFPLLFSRQKIEPFTETQLWLRPQENESSLKN